MFQVYSFLAVPVFLFAAFTMQIAAKRKWAPAMLMMLASIAGILLLLSTIPLISKGPAAYTLGGWATPYGITIALDNMSAVFAALALAALFFVTMFSLKTVEPPATEYYSLLALFGAGVLGIIHTADLFNLFVFFEITSISSYALSCITKTKGAFSAAINYLVLGSFGTSLLLLGIAFIYGITGTLNMADIASKLTVNTNGTAVMIAYAMIAAGILLKAAIVPLHAWKPAILRHTSPEIGALFASASAATAMYAFFRVSYDIFGFAASAAFQNILLAAGVLTMVVGAAMAFAQKNLLSLLAYSAISQAGYVFAAFGLANYAAGIFHSINIVIIELTLFLSAGSIIKEAKSSDMHAIGASGASHPVLYWAMLLAFLSNAGVPLLNGFSSKWVIYASGVQSAPLVALVAILVSAMTLAYSLKAFDIMFGGTKARAIVVPRLERTCLYVLAGAIIFFGIFYGSGLEMSGSAANSLLGSEKFMLAVFGGGL